MAVASHEVVQLRRAYKPWRPRHQRLLEEAEKDPEERQTQELLCCFRSLLNKLTPQTLLRLLGQFAWMPIYAEHHLGGMADMVVERAISEPQFSEAYAELCRRIMELKAPMEDEPWRTANFRKLLLNRCQAEFEMNLNVLLKKKIESQIYSCIMMEWQKAMKEVLEKEKQRKRLLGIVKFICELFKLKMVGECIVHECIAKLLLKRTNEALESLCLLLCVIGKDLDYEKAMHYMCQYFQEMEKIIEERQSSNRIRFLLQEVIDLRQSKWIPRQPPQTNKETMESPSVSKKRSRRRANRAPKGPGAAVSGLDPPLLEPQQDCLSVPTSLSQDQGPKTGTLKLITPLFVLGDEGSYGGSGIKPSESVNKELASHRNQYVYPVAAASGPASEPASRPASGPASVPAAGTGTGTVACVISPLEEDLSCPVCCDIYTDPVVLPCSHSFCRPCLDRSWTEGGLLHECLLCRQKTSTHNPTPNLALRNVCEAFLKERGTGAQAVPEDLSIPETHIPMCSKHDDQLQFYCLDEEQLVCVECVLENHQTHKVCSAKKAARVRKDQLNCLIKTMEADVRENKILLESVTAHIKAQAAQTEALIKEEFEKLHQFLRREEEARITALRREERDKTANLEEKMEAIERVISDLSEKIKPIQTLMEIDEVSFIQKFPEIKKRTQEAFRHPQPGLLQLLDESKYLDKLSYSVWVAMNGVVANSTNMGASNTDQSDISPPEYLADILHECESGMVPHSSRRRSPEGQGSDGVIPGWRQLVDDD